MAARLGLVSPRVCAHQGWKKEFVKAKDWTSISGILVPEAGETVVVRDRRNQDSYPPIAWGQGRERKRDGGSTQELGIQKETAILRDRMKLMDAEPLYFPPTLSILNPGTAHGRVPVTERADQVPRVLEVGD